MKRGLPSVHSSLSDPRTYERQIERLHKRYIFSRHLYELRQDGVSFASIVQRQSSFAQILARTVSSGNYQFEPAQVKNIRVDNKVRQVFSLRLTDRIVHGAVASLVEEASAPFLSSCLYSYRSRVSWWAPLSGFAAFARAHYRERPDPKTRGLYVIRRDVDAYTDSIPVGATSPLWPMLREILDSSQNGIEPADWRLIETVVRPEAFIKPSALFTPRRGVPTGQPISCVLFNLYLHRLDHELSAIPGGFYARYSDDILFAHPDASVTRWAAARVEEALAALGLSVSVAKSQNLYLTAAGRASSDWPEACGTPSIPFLGCRVSATGTISLSRRKTRRLLRDVRVRAEATARSINPASQEKAGRIVCSVVNRLLAPKTSVLQQRSATLLRRAVTDRHQLTQLDHWIARIVLRAVTGVGSIKAFRMVSYKTVREQWGLVSVLHARNKWARRSLI